MCLCRAGSVLQAALFAGLVVCSTNCASPNVNPPSAKAHKGYVDFYSPGHTNLYWSVKRLDSGTGTLQPVFSELEPLPGGVLRLEQNPGLQQFQITFLNRVLEAPLTLPVPVQEGRVTPVKVELVPGAETSIQRKEEKVGANVMGAGRKSRYSSQAGSIERLTAAVQPSMAYRPKQQMRYPP